MGIINYKKLYPYGYNLSRQDYFILAKRSTAFVKLAIV